MWMGAVRNTSCYPKLNGSHFGLPPSSIHRMTALGGNFVWAMTYSHRPNHDATAQKLGFTQVIWVEMLYFKEISSGRIVVALKWTPMRKSVKTCTVKSICSVHNTRTRDIDSEIGRQRMHTPRWSSLKLEKRFGLILENVYCCAIFVCSPATDLTACIQRVDVHSSPRHAMKVIFPGPAPSQATHSAGNRVPASCCWHADV